MCVFYATVWVWEETEWNGVFRCDSNVWLLAVAYTLVCVCVSGCVCVESECDAWVMSGDTSSLSMRSMSPTSQSDSSDLSPTAHVTRDGLFHVKIIKVCFLSNSSNLGKNFKLVRCEEGWTVRVCSFLLYSTVVFILPYSVLLYSSTLWWSILIYTSLLCYIILCYFVLCNIILHW